MPQITISTETMKEGLAQVGPAVDRRAIIRAFQSIRIRIEGSMIELMSGSVDGQTTFRAELDESVKQPIDVCVAADRLAPLVAVADETIDVSMQKNGRIKFSTSSYNVALPSLPGSEFPVVKVEGDPSVDVDVSGLSELIAGVIFAANPKDIRPFCQGVWLESDGTQVSATATNSNVLATAQVQMAAPPFAVMLSVPASELLIGLNPVRIALYESHFKAYGANTELVINPMSKKPIEWRRTLPDPKNSITFDGKALREAVAMYRHYGDKVGGVRFSTSGNECTLEVAAQDNDARAALDVEIGEDETAFNYAFIGSQLSQILQRAPVESVTFYWNAKNARAFLVQNGNWRGVISPLTI